VYLYKKSKMEKNILNEIDQMKYLVNYKAGRVVSEQEQPKSNKILYTDNFGNQFDSGKYSFNPSYTDAVNEKIVKIADFIKDGNVKDFKIVINSGESQVPNQPPFDKEKGSLAKKRAEVLKSYLEKTLLPVLPVKPVIEVTTPVIGQTPWEDKKGKDHEDYKKEQYVNASVESLREVPIPPPPPPPPPPPQKTKFMISWTLDRVCDRIKFFKTYQEMIAMADRMRAAGYDTRYRESRGPDGREFYGVVKLQQLSQDPPSEFFDGPFFDNCSQSFVARK
jgi:hypothetical protein